MKKNKKRVDYIILGQGLAGSLLAYSLMERGQSVHLFDNHHQGASSKVAAGLMNPITGRRFVKSWMIDDLFPFAVKTYRAIEKEFGVEIYKEREILRALFSVKEENSWDERSGIDSYAPYMNSSPVTNGIEAIVQAPFSWGGLRAAGQVDVPKLLQVFQNHFREKGMLEEEPFQYDALVSDKNGVQYKSIHAKKIIFCEGHQARFNPWFSALPFVPSKGEMLEIKLPDHELTSIVKHKSYIAPLAGKTYWVGSTYEWDDLSENPSEKGRELLLNSLNKMMAVPYEVVNHLAAIRPTVKDRRPFIGAHPDNKSLLIFNGLGTKGTSLGPYWASAFCDYILDGKALEVEVDVARYF